MHWNQHTRHHTRESTWPHYALLHHHTQPTLYHLCTAHGLPGQNQRSGQRMPQAVKGFDPRNLKRGEKWTPMQKQRSVYYSFVMRASL